MPVTVHAFGRSREPAAGPLGDGLHHVQVAQQLLGWGDWRRRLHLPLRFQEQLGLLQDPLPHRKRCIAPGGVQLPGLAGMELVPGEAFRHALAILQVHPRHRHQKLHGGMRREGALAHLLLNGFRQQFHQRQAARHPTHAAIKLPRQLFQAIAETLFQLRQQPTLFQRGVALGGAQGAVQQQSLGFAHGPHHRLHGVAAQLLQSRHAFEAVDDQVTVGLVRQGHYHDGPLLAQSRQRSQQPAFTIRTAHPEMFPTPIELVKLQSHRKSGIVRPVAHVEQYARINWRALCQRRSRCFTRSGARRQACEQKCCKGLRRGRTKHS